MMAGGRELGKRFQAGEIIFHQGEAARCMYVIQSGRVDVVMESDFGPRHLNTLAAGDFIGEISLFADRTRIATARAVTDVRVLQLDEKTFMSRLHQDPSLAYRLIRKLANRIYEQDHELMRDHASDVETCPISGFTSYIDLSAFLESEIRRARRLRQTLAFAIIDIDGFAALVETFGEGAGEMVIKRLALLLNEHLRRTDVAGRFGADRFGVLLYEADGTSAVKVCEKVRTAFSNLRFEMNGTFFSTTLTCGIAIFPEYNQSAKMNQAAFKAVLTGKSSGKNRVILAEADRVS